MTTTLGSLAWEIEISEEEMQRISMLLADKSHFAPDTFKNNIIKVRGFGEQAKQFHREVSGLKSALNTTISK